MMGFLPDQASGQAERSRRVLPSQDPASPAAGQNSTPSQGATAGQSPAKKSEPLPSQDQAEAIRINSTLIAVPVSVTDTSGEPVRNLKPDDFLLDEEGKAQQVVSLGEPGKTPVEIALLFDVSGSVNKRFEFEQQAASRFLRQVVKPNDAASIFAIGFTPRLIQAREMDVDRVITSVLAMAPTKEATAFFDSVVIAARYLGRASEAGTRRVMIVISDGEDNHSESLRLTDALREVQQADCLLYSINPSGPSIRLNKISMKGQEGLVALASATGGAPFLPDKLEDLDAVFRQIAAELQAQYLLGYYSTDERTDGGYRQIAVRVSKKPELRVRARKGYYAPKA
ncbi:MAG TPA: VWA domain-containing protein [Blastocatellia bacterium]|nr:VWA domain-containing protein [Blastocatellia bacterium]